MGDYVCRFAKPYQQERTDFSKDCLYTVKFTDIYGGSIYGNYSKSVIGKTVYKQLLESNLWSFEGQENYDKRNDNTIDIYRGGDYILSYKKDNDKKIYIQKTSTRSGKHVYWTFSWSFGCGDYRTDWFN